MGVKLKITDNTAKLDKAITQGLTDAFTDIVLDIKRVSSESAPHKTGYLENNRFSITETSKGIEGYVGFEARSKRGFDYATWTHDKDYTLGEKSKAKRGGRSKYGAGAVPVGKGYLKNTIDNNRAGYTEHLGGRFKYAIKKGG